MKRIAVTLPLGIAILVLSTLAFIPSGLPGASASAPITPFSWNTKVPCTPLVVRVTEITANHTGSASFIASRFSPGTTPPVSGGDSKRWLTPGLTPPGWFAPGPSCIITNTKGATSLFVEIDGVKRSSLTNEDWSTLYDPTNGGNAHSTLTGDTTFNLFDPAVVPDYSSSCASAADTTCYGRIHAEIDHDWKAAGYCGTGTVCDNATLASHTSSDSTMIDVQGFIYWDADTLNANWHQFNGWELHPLTAWKLSSSPPPVPFSVSATPPNPQVGEPVTFKAAASNGTNATSFNWDFGDSVTASGSSVSHIFMEAQSFSVYVTMTDNLGKTFTTFIAVNVGSWNPGVDCVPAPTTLEGVLGNASIQRVPSDPASLGADYSGGGFKLDGSLPYGSNPTTWPFFKRDIQIPCKANGVPTFVEFHNVTVVNKSRDDCSTTYSADNGGGPYPHGWQSCDVTFTLATPRYGDDSCPACYMHRLYAGIDRDWNASGIAPPIPIEGQRIDIQGYIYWNDANVNASFHSFSGWELHPVAAWQLTHLPIVAGISYSPSNPTSAQTITFNGTGSGGTGPYTFNWDFGNGTVGTGSTATHTFEPGTYTVHLSARDSHGAVGTASRNVTVVFPPDFAVSAAPSSITFPAGTSTSSIINVSSIHGFSDTVSLTTATSSGLTGSFSPNTVTPVPGEAASSTLTLTSTIPGTHTVSVIATSGLLSHSSSLTVGVVDVGPTVGFSESRDTAFRNQPITLTISSSDIDGTVDHLRVTWGDGTIDDLPGNAVTDTHTYAIAGAFTVNVKPTDNAGLTSNSSAVITIIDQPPVPVLTQSLSKAPTGTPINFDGSASLDPDGSILSYEWNFGDGFTDAGIDTGHTYALAADYIVTLTVTDNATLTASITSVVHITDRPPLVSFSESATIATTGAPVTLTINAIDPDGSATSLIIMWGDRTTVTLLGNATSVSHAYSHAGSYAIYVNATDDAGLTTMSSPSNLTIIDRPPIINFSESANNVSTGAPVTLNINTTDPDGVVTAVTVNWGDGSVDTLTGAATMDRHVYTSTGGTQTEIFTISVTVVDDATLTSTDTALVRINDIPPAASFTSSTASALTGEGVNFNATTSSDPDGSITSYFWNFGDGSTATGATVSHSYANTGSSTNRAFTVTLTVTDNSGNAAMTEMVETVIDRSPLARFTTSTQSALTGASITFNATDSVDPDGSLSTYSWTFGDGETANGATAAHSYAFAGDYNVRVTVIDNGGSQASATFTVTVLDRPPVTVAWASSTSSPTLQIVNFYGIDSFDPDGTIIGYAWNFGDGSAGTGITTSHSFAKAGNYTVVLGVTDNNGMVSFGRVHLVILDRNPTAAFTYTPGSPLVGQTLSLDGSSSFDPDGTVVSFAWTFGDGLSGAEESISHMYAANGTYTITLTITDDNGGVGTSQALVTVGMDPAPTWGAGSSISAIRIGAHSVTLGWAGAIDSVRVSNYTLYVNGTLLINLPSSASSFTVTGLNALSYYEFKIQAGNPSGNYSSDGPSTGAFTSLLGDLNLDCQVDISDLAIMGSIFGQNLGDTRYNPRADLNGDGTIDVSDLAILGSNFGQTC